jgi:hypothetical protein
VSELTVPTVPLSVKIKCRDGRVLAGRVFVPAAAPTHPGPIRAEDWVNEPTAFFPFLAKGAKAPILLNKREVDVVELSAEADVADKPIAEDALPARRVRLELGKRKLEGTLVIEMPETHSRVLDVLNLPTTFLTLRSGELRRLVQKARITRVTELEEE